MRAILLFASFCLLSSRLKVLCQFFLIFWAYRQDLSNVCIRALFDPSSFLHLFETKLLVISLVSIKRKRKYRGKQNTAAEKRRY